MMRFTTLSGSTYEIDNDFIRRTNPTATKRADDEWIRLNWHSDITVGHSVILELESLSEYGSDDYGFHGSDNPYTVRTTSLVTSVEEVSA